MAWRMSQWSLKAQKLHLQAGAQKAVPAEDGMQDDEYIYDEESGEWLPASEVASRKAAASEVQVKDSQGTILADGDQVVLIKDLPVKGAGQTLKRGTLIKSIRLTDNPEEIDCRFEGIKGLVLRTEFVRKR